MVGYFNKTRSVITVSLKNGESAVIAPKKMLTVTSEQDGSASLHAMVRRKLLARVTLQSVSIPVKSESVSTPTPSVPVEPPPVEPLTPEKQEETPNKQWTKAKLRAYAESMGLDVPFGWTKVEILEAIEGVG